MAPRRCDAPVIPARPDSELCIAAGNGQARCFDPRRGQDEYLRPIEHDDVITNIIDHNSQDIWMAEVLRACRQ
jgi:hypothetical protein